MGGKGDTSPDNKELQAYMDVADLQADAAKDIVNEQTWANRPTQITPWGTLDYSVESVVDPVTGELVPSWTQTLSLTEAEQAALDDQMAINAGKSDLALGMIDTVADAYADPMDWSALQDYGELDMGTLDYSGAYEVGDPDRYRAEAEAAIYDSLTSRLDPQWEQDANAMEVQLRSQGLQPGDQAYDDAMANFNRAKTDAYSQAQYDAFLGGSAEADRVLAADLARRGLDTGEIDALLAAAREGSSAEATYDNMLRQQQIAEMLLERGTPLNELNAILYGTQVAMPGQPDFMAAGAAETPQYLTAQGMADQSALDSYNAQVGQFQGLLGGLSGLATGGADLWSVL